MKNKTEFDFTPQGVEKELNFAQSCGLAAVILVVLLVLGNLFLGLD